MKLSQNGDPTPSLRDLENKLLTIQAIRKEINSIPFPLGPFETLDAAMAAFRQEVANRLSALHPFITVN